MSKFTLIPTDDPMQALRIRRMLMGVTSYSLYTIVTLICWYFGIFTVQIVAGYLLIIFTVNGGLYLALRSGFNLRFRDPSLTLFQLSAAIPTGLYLMYFAQDKRMIFVLMGVPVFLFGIFRFRLREFLIIGITAISGYICMMYLLARHGEKVDFSSEFLTVLALMAMMIQIAMLGSYISSLRLKIKDKNAELANRNEQLLERTNELSSANQEVQHTLASLRVAHEELVRKEKLAALGSLVAGIAHEINTPIGNSLLAASMLNDETRSFNEQFALGQRLQAATLNNYIVDAGTACDILLVNLRRAADLITSFKQVAIDQTSSQRRSFPLTEVVHEILMMLSPVLKLTNYEVKQEIADSLCLDSYPGPLGQVLTNLLNNAILHGFDGRDEGSIELAAWKYDAQHIALQVKDNGVGIPTEHLKRVFDPFFTTKLGTGGSGLGLNITHNIVSGVLGGRIEVSSVVGEGSQFTLYLPIVAPDNLPSSADPE